MVDASQRSAGVVIAIVQRLKGGDNTKPRLKLGSIQRATSEAAVKERERERGVSDAQVWK